MVTYEQDYHLKLPIITAIPENQIKIPTMYVMQYLREAHALQDRCEEDKAELMASGLAWDLVSDISARAGAYYNAECNAEAIVKWKEVTERLKSQLDSLVPVFRKAYRDHPYVLDRLETIVACRYADEPQALLDLVGLGLDFPGYLDDSFNAKEWFSKAMLLQGEYGYLERTVGDAEHRKRIRTIRDQAFTHLKEAVDEVCARARQVWQENDARLKGYSVPNFTFGFVHQEPPVVAD